MTAAVNSSNSHDERMLGFNAGFGDTYSQFSLVLILSGLIEKVKDNKKFSVWLDRFWSTALRSRMATSCQCYILYS